MGNLVIIPARGGSKGVPCKNIKPLNGKPLIHYTLEVASQTAKPEDICVTTDDDGIIAAVRDFGMEVPFKRPAELAGDAAGMYETLLHALDHYKQLGRDYDTITLLQPTSPFRTSNQVREAQQLFRTGIEMVVSVVETPSNPYYVLFEENESGFLTKSKPGNFKRRQDCPKVWEYNGAIYVIDVPALRVKPLSEFSRIIKYEMDEMSSLDIDTMIDWKLAEIIAAERSAVPKI